MAIDRTLKAYQMAQGTALVEQAQRFLDSQTAAIQKVIRDAGGLTTLENVITRASESLAGMDALMRTGAYQPLRAWSFNEPEVQSAAASVTASALVGIAEQTLTVEALDDEIVAAAAGLNASYDELLPEVSVKDAVRYAIWMVVSPALVIMWDDALVGPWLQSHIELLVVLLGLTMWGLQGNVIPRPFTSAQ